MVTVAAILAEYVKNDSQHYKADSGTIRVYSATFVRFAKAVSLEKHSKQALAGKKGYELLKEFLWTTPATGTRQIINSHLKRIWTKGLNLPYPVTRDDLGKLRPMGENPVPCPNDGEVKPLIEEMDSEPDAYLKSLMATLVEFGFRPEQMRKLKWRNLVAHPNEPQRIFGFYAKGSQESFKRDSPLVAYTPDCVSDALAAWRTQSQDTKSDSFIWPNRSRAGEVQYGRQLSEDGVRIIFEGYLDRMTKRGIKSNLVPYSMRHFATDKAEKRLSNKLSEIRQGRVLDGYGRGKNPLDFMDEMKLAWPEGLIGSLKAPAIKWIDETESHVLALWRKRRQRKIRFSEFMTEAERLDEHWLPNDIRTLEP